MVAEVVNEWGRQHYSMTTPYDKEWKRLNLFGRKGLSSVTLQFRIAIFDAVMAKYNHTNYSKLSQFIDFILEDKKEQFKSVISEGHLLARMTLQASLDSADMAARSIATSIMMQWTSWLHLSGFPREVQSTVEDLPFECPKLFAGKTDEFLHTLKDSRVTFRSLGIYTSAQK